MERARSSSRVHYQFGFTLLLPLGVTNLERKGLLCAAPTKLSLDALQDLIALAEESGGHMPIEPREVWRSLPETLRQAIAEDFGQVLREMSDGLGTRQAGSPGPQGSGVCAAIDATPSDHQTRKPEAAVRPLAARSRSRMARGGHQW